MRKLIYLGLLGAMVAPATAYAQSAREVRHDQRELRHDQHELRHDRREVRRDVRHGDYRQAREDRRELRRDRAERREDWRDYRARNREIFRQPRYVGPSGYRHRVWQPGWRLPRAYYGSRYIIANPWHYRLTRPAHSYMRWVRYGDDVLLVDMRNGRIREVIRDFFW